MLSQRLLVLLAAALTACADAPAGPREAAHATVPPLDTAPQPYDAPAGPTDALGRAYTVIFSLSATGGAPSAMHSRDFEAYATTTSLGGRRVVSVVSRRRALLTLTLPAARPLDPHARLLVRCDGASPGYVRAAALLIEAAGRYDSLPTHPSRRALAVAARRFDDAWQRWQEC